MSDKMDDIHISIPKEDKKSFIKWCKENATNPTLWLRKKIYEVINKDKG